MARKLPVQYPGAIYHVMNRGDRREAIFTDDHDRQMFLDTLGEACQKADWNTSISRRSAPQTFPSAGLGASRIGRTRGFNPRSSGCSAASPKAFGSSYSEMEKAGRWASWSTCQESTLGGRLTPAVGCLSIVCGCTRVGKGSEGWVVV